MIVAVLLIALCMSVHPSISAQREPGGASQDRSAEIAELLKKLAPIVEESPGFFVSGPTEETKDNVRRRLVARANESAESRAIVIRALTDVLNDPNEGQDIVTETRWNVVAGLLGELNATEAIPDLVRNLNRMGQGVRTLPHDPPVRRALVRIGKPAIPSLVDAISSSQAGIRREASFALAEIGQPAFDQLVDTLSRGGPSSRGGAALALGMIGGTKATEAIRNALEAETDKDVKKELEEALRYSMENYRRK